MSRLEEEYILAVVRNRSGMDAGEIDFSIPVDKFEGQRVTCLNEIIKTLDHLKSECINRIKTIDNCEHEWKEQEPFREFVKFYRCRKCNVKR